ncbi:MAG: alcohol dehydrogenase catalytic domain-containing protein [Anaerolineae bacterium]|nr:alcohol dehydrogenase catalytic domain-containing protein [Anaerolineae bacterium]
MNKSQNTMHALVWTAPRAMEMQTLPIPVLEPDEVLIKVAYAGICGSELSGYLGHNALRVPPLVMGHEFSGEIVALGKDVTTLTEGQNATVFPFTACGVCAYCVQGMPQLCVSRKLLGAHRPGAFAEYVAVPAVQVFPLPSEMSLRLGALTEPVACGVRVGEWVGAVAGEVALIIGAGPIGLLSLLALKIYGAKRIFIADLDPARLEIGAALGGEVLDPRAVDVIQVVREATGGLGSAVSVDAVGAAMTRRQCISATRALGRVVLSGLHEETSAMPVADVIRRELTLQGSFSYSPANFSEAIKWLQEGRVPLDPWLVEAPLLEGGLWFDRLIEGPGGVAKVLLIP